MRRRAWRVRCVRAASPTVRRSIRFEPLSPGEWAYSRSESFWLARCGVLTPDRSNPLYGLWQTLPEDIRLSPNTYLATNSPLGPWWILGWAERVPGRERSRKDRFLYSENGIYYSINVRIQTFSGYAFTVNYDQLSPLN